MLGVFQQVAIQVSEQESGQIATFDLMFEGIRAALKGNIQRSILVAEKHLDHRRTLRLSVRSIMSSSSFRPVCFIRSAAPAWANLTFIVVTVPFADG